MRCPAAELDAAVEHVADLLVDHALGQPELGNLRAHHAAGLRVAVEHDEVVAERRQVARDGERRGARADERDALAVLLLGPRRQPRPDVVLVVRGDALQPADRDRFRLALLVAALLDASATARGLAGTVARASENPGKDVRLPVDEIGVVVLAGGDQADVFGNRGVGRARPLAIDDLVEVIGVRDIRRLQTDSSSGFPVRARALPVMRKARRALVFGHGIRCRDATPARSRGKARGRIGDSRSTNRVLRPPLAIGLLRRGEHAASPAQPPPGARIGPAAAPSGAAQARGQSARRKGPDAGGGGICDN